MSKTNKGGRPKGSRETEPRDGSMAKIVCECFDNPECQSTRDIKKLADMNHQVTLTSTYINQALTRWRPDWKDRYHGGDS